MCLSVTETTVNNCVLGIVQPFCNPFYDVWSSGYGSIRNINSLLKERDRYSSENKRQFLSTTFNSAGTVFGLPSSSAALATLDRDARKIAKNNNDNKQSIFVSVSLIDTVKQIGYLIASTNQKSTSSLITKSMLLTLSK